VTSTCFALQTILASGDSQLYDSLVAADDEKDGRIPIRAVLHELLFADWRKDDLFQVPLLLYTALKVDSQRIMLGPTGMNEELAAKVNNFQKYCVIHVSVRFA
jgi:hypothetical protein